MNVHILAREANTKLMKCAPCYGACTIVFFTVIVNFAL